jgi:hypothetical protein
MWTVSRRDDVLVQHMLAQTLIPYRFLIISQILLTLIIQTLVLAFYEVVDDCMIFIKDLCAR